MIKKIIVILMCFVSITAFASSNILPAACQDAVPTNDINFCPSFKSVATCYCTSSGLPAGMCQDMNALYNRMISVFGSIQKACAYQRYTSTQNCIDNWNCYRLGGIDSRGRLCSSNQQACQ